MFTHTKQQATALTWFGGLALSIYALSWLLHGQVAAVAKTALVVYTLLSVLLQPQWFVQKRGLCVAALGFLLLQWGSYVWVQRYHPQFATQPLLHTLLYSELWLALGVAHWLQGSVKRVHYVLWLAMLGFLLSLVVQFDAAMWQAGVNGRRVALGYTNAQHGALLAGLGWLFAVFATYHLLKQQCRLAALGTFTLMLVCFVAVVITQTRAVWLGLLVALAAVALVVFVRQQQRRLSGQGVVLLLLLPLLAGLVLAKPIVEKRLGVEREGIVQVLRGNTQQLALDSVGVRVVMWQFAATKIAERPWLGWGADTRLYLFADDAWPSKIQHRFGRFHNSYLEVLVAYGVGGLLALAWLVWCSTLGMLRLLRSHAASTGAGVLAGWLLFAMANHFESYVVMATGRFFVVLLAGVGLTFYVAPLQRKGQ